MSYAKITETARKKMEVVNRLRGRVLVRVMFLCTGDEYHGRIGTCIDNSFATGETDFDSYDRTKYCTIIFDGDGFQQAFDIRRLHLERVYDK